MYPSLNQISFCNFAGRKKKKCLELLVLILTTTKFKPAEELKSVQRKAEQRIWATTLSTWIQLCLKVFLPGLFHYISQCVVCVAGLKLSSVCFTCYWKGPKGYIIIWYWGQYDQSNGISQNLAKPKIHLASHTQRQVYLIIRPDLGPNSSVVIELL